MRARRPARGQAQHPRAKCGKHQIRSRHPVAEQHIDIAGERLVGPRVLLDGLAVARAHAEQEPARVAGLHAGEGRRHLAGIALPHVHDARRHREPGRRVE